MKRARPFQAALTAGIVLLCLAVPARPQALPEAGFITLEENTFYFHLGSYFNRIALRSSPARIWYVYQPADEDPETKPLFVFFNGGPGGATSCGLLAAYTGRQAVEWDQSTGQASIIANPASWTRLGNLLYIDSRTTGFSYSLMDGPGDDARRAGEFDAQNYNSYTDGADFVRFLLRFLAAHPSVRGNRVVLVPESYGGIRTTVMLHLLLYYEKYADGRSVYQDPGLVEEIRAHYEAVFPGYLGRTVPPDVAAGQFGHQVLIQTALAWPYQCLVQVEMLEAPGSVLDGLAAETGVPYVRFRDRPGANQNPTPAQVRNYILTWVESLGRDVYHYARPEGFLDGHRAASAGLLTRLETLNLMTGVDATAIGDLYASARSGAYKTRAGESPALAARDSFANRTLRGAKGSAAKSPAGGRLPARIQSTPRRGVRLRLSGPDLSSLLAPPSRLTFPASGRAAPEGDLSGVFGSLEPWDRFFIDLNYDVTDAFSWNRVSLREYDIHFQTDLAYGRMFLENTAWVETFATDAYYDMVVYTASLPAALGLYTSILSASVHDPDGPPGAARPGLIQLTYRPGGIPGSSVTGRTIRFPAYLASGHAVTMTEPAGMLEDVVDWLETTGIPVRGR